MTRDVEHRLREAWSRSDEIFEIPTAAALYEQPIRLRHPLIFYLGHLPAFAWNQVGRGLLGRPPFNPEFDVLFERGIDPMGTDDYHCDTRWPEVEAVVGYRDRVRHALLDAIADVAARADRDPLADRDRIWSVVIEHELMHQETLQYMLQQLPSTHKVRPDGCPAPVFDGARKAGVVEVRGGTVGLGADHETVEFGWDNEFPEHRLEVKDFSVDRTPVRISQYLEFVRNRGYHRSELWAPDDWSWRQRMGLSCPMAWSPEDGRFGYLAMFDRLELDRVADWPVYVSLAEARAYCRWIGARLPKEAEFHRAAYTSPDGSRRLFPWGDDAPGPDHGNFDFRHWAPTPVGAFPAGDSAWGVAELVGNGWEWTSTPLAPFPGFTPNISSYPGYSADFFDDRHFVMLGASWATPATLIRRSFRNWFHAHYPFVFATFRCVHAG